MLDYARLPNRLSRIQLLRTGKNDPKRSAIGGAAKKSRHPVPEEISPMVTPIRNGSSSLIELAGIVVSAYVSNNSLPSSELPKLIDRVHAALNEIMNADAVDRTAELEEKATTEQIQNSITPDALISFIDGKPYKTLKRHLAGHGLDPFSYRKRFGLPPDYPMVALHYAQRRSEIARGITLGVYGGHSKPTRTDARH